MADESVHPVPWVLRVATLLFGGETKSDVGVPLELCQIVSLRDGVSLFFADDTYYPSFLTLPLFHFLSKFFISKPDSILIRVV